MIVKLEDTFWLHFGTTSSSTGNATNADSTPVVTIEEDGTTLAYAATVVNSGVGLYRVAIVASTANGFEAGKRYAAWVAATVGGATGRDGLDSWLVDAADLGDTLSSFAAILGNQTSLLVAVKSTWSNTVSLGVASASLLSNVNSLAITDTAQNVSLASLLSNVNTVYVLDTSMMVSVKSALSNTLAILVSTSSLLSNVTNVDTDLATVAGNVTTILADTTSAAVSLASLLSNVAAVSVSTASLLSNIANVDADLAAALTTIPANVRDTVIEGTLTVEGALRVILAWASGGVSVSGAVRTFMDLAGTTPRITGTEDANGQRSGVVVDGS